MTTQTDPFYLSQNATDRLRPIRHHVLMKKPRLVGLLKFFSQEKFLDEFLNGLVYCNTPEYYRVSEQDGVGDHHESCSICYRESRNDTLPDFKVNGKEVKGLTALTIHNGSLKDMWLHCWLAFDFPQSKEEFQLLLNDINRVRRECGNHFVFLHWKNLNEYVARLQKLQNGKFLWGRVEYSDDRSDWSVKCKSSPYSYQREFRFAFGKCDDHSIEPFIGNYPEGFADLIDKNPNIQLTNDEGEILLRLDDGGSVNNQLDTYLA